MDFIITFFRDVLDGPLYIVIAVIAGILICSCIGYLAERSIIKKREKKKYEQEHFNVDTSSVANSNIEVRGVDSSVQAEPSVEMETIQISNPSTENEPQQSIPEMDNSSTNVDSTGQEDVNSMQNIGK